MDNDPQTILDLLKNIHGYPFDPLKDTPLVSDLLLEFPEVDFPEQIKRLKIWLSDIPSYSRPHYRLLLRTWIKNASNKLQ